MLLQSLGDDLIHRADFFAGTSTGAIIAGGLACGVGIDTINEVYRSRSACRTIFTPYHSFTIPILSHLLSPRYRSSGVRSILAEFLDTEKPIASLDRHCFLPSFLIDGSNASGQPQWRATAFHNLGSAAGIGGFDRVPVIDAIMASAAAPMYFLPHRIGALLFADGGVAANNPSMSALAAATHANIVGPQAIPLDRVCMLSLGTGRTESSYPPAPPSLFPPAFGVLGWNWPESRGKSTPGMPAIDATFDGVAQLNDFQVRSVLGEDNYRRAELDFGPDSFPMDDYSKVHGRNGLIERTERFMRTDYWQEIASWTRNRLE